MDKTTKKPERVLGTKEPTTSAKARILTDEEIDRMRAQVEAAEAEAVK